MLTRVVVAALVIGLFALAAVAGPLDPPAGPIAPTAKPLAEVEPRIAINATNTPGDASSQFRITAPGSYYLTANVQGVAGKHGIVIASGNVTVDLNGFALVGAAASLDGITDNSDQGFRWEGITIRNGSVSNWVNGVFISRISQFVSGSVIEGVHASRNRGQGFRSRGDGCVFNRCTAEFNNQNGFLIDFSAVVTECTALSNDLNGFSTGGVSTIAHCLATQNLGIGFAVGSNSVISDCSASLNTGAGFNSGTGSSATGCAANSNSSHGFQFGNNSHIVACIARGNGLDGIRANGSSLIRDNCCSSNGTDPAGGAGVHVIGSDNRIEGNNCTANDTGVDVDAAGNFVVRNICSGNTTDNWNIVANNIVGPILNRTAPASAAIVGDSAPSSLGTTDANANFTY